MANPIVAQGTLNKLRGSVTFTDNPQLNARASNLMPEGISIAFEGTASGYPETMTGAVPSPNPYMIATVSIHLLRTQGLSSVWKNQIEKSTTIGDLFVTTDTTTLAAYSFSNATIQNQAELALNGSSPDYTVVVKGTYYINSSLFVSN